MLCVITVVCRSTGEVDATYKDSGLTHTVLSAVVESNGATSCNETFVYFNNLLAMQCTYFGGEPLTGVFLRTCVPQCPFTNARLS